MAYPSSSSSILFHNMRGEQLRSFRKVTSVSSISSHSYNQQAGERTTITMALNELGKNVYPHIAGEIIYALRPLPQPNASSAITASEEGTLSIHFSAKSPVRITTK